MPPAKRVVNSEKAALPSASIPLAPVRRDCYHADMNQIRRCLFMLLACGLLLPAAGCRTLFRCYPRPAPDAIVPVIAVSSFENRSGFPGEWQLGSDMADLLVNELITSRNFTVVERREFDRILKELGLQQTPHFRAEGRMNRGRLINVHYLIRGTITDFFPDAEMAERRGVASLAVTRSELRSGDSEDGLGFSVGQHQHLLIGNAHDEAMTRVGASGKKEQECARHRNEKAVVHGPLTE